MPFQARCRHSKIYSLIFFSCKYIRKYIYIDIYILKGKGPHIFFLVCQDRFQEIFQFASFTQLLQVVVAPNMLTVDVDVWHGSLAIELVQGCLDVHAVLHLVQLQDQNLGLGHVHLLEQRVQSCVAVWTVRLGRNEDLLLRDKFLDVIDSFLGYHYL